MKRVILTLIALSCIPSSALAQGKSFNPYVGNGPNGTNLIPASPFVYGNPYGYTPYGNPYAGSPYGSNPLFNPVGGYGYNPWLNRYGNPYAYNGVPINSFGAPVSIGNGFFGLSTNGRNLNFWKAPSGYYYPWTYGYGSSYTAPIVVINNGSTTPQPAQPPLSTVFSDTLKYLDEQKASGKISEADFTHLKQRCLDLLSKERSLKTANGGALDTQQEASIRADVDSLGGEIAQRVKP